jgi:phage shock protein E
LISLVFASSPGSADEVPSNPLINYPAFEKIVLASQSERASHRLTEQQFLQAMSTGGTVLIDARSSNKYLLRHVRGAINLPFTDFTADSLGAVIPTKDTRVLIYCNNNFLGSPAAFASKAPSASLNLSTYTSLKSYGYDNVYELGPLLDVNKTSIPFDGTEVH